MASSVMMASCELDADIWRGLPRQDLYCRHFLAAAGASATKFSLSRSSRDTYCRKEIVP